MRIIRVLCIHQPSRHEKEVTCSCACQDLVCQCQLGPFAPGLFLLLPGMREEQDLRRSGGGAQG